MLRTPYPYSALPHPSIPEEPGQGAAPAKKGSFKIKILLIQKKKIFLNMYVKLGLSLIFSIKKIWLFFKII